MWGIIPAAGVGSRIQPLAFSKELLPVGSRCEHGTARPRAVSEYLVERMVLAGATRLCFVISADKCDIIQYFGNSIGQVHICYVVQPRPAGLCDALFQPLHLIGAHEQVLVGLPDTVWFPEDAFTSLPDDELSFLLFSVERPQLFDAVLTDNGGHVREIRVKHSDPGTSWVWGSFKFSGLIMRELYRLWCTRSPRDEYLGTLVNAYLAEGGTALGVRRGEEYVDVGTLDGYWNAIRMLEKRQHPMDAPTGSEIAAHPALSL
jgi:glucose-1-phosphate thymidylyltransferase